MRLPTIPARPAPTRVRAVVLAIASLVTAALLTGAVAGPAQAHHGFDDYDTDRLYYVSGTVSEVRWGDPHSYFTLTVDGDLPADTPDLELPEQLQAPEDSDPVEAAPSYPGSRDELAVTIAPPTYTGMWGLDRPLEDDERVEAVGYIGRSHDEEFRPVVFWYDEGQPVNQVLGSELPARPLPVPYADDASSEGAAFPASDTNPAVVWGATGLVLLVAVVGGVAYVRSRANRV
ncbi:DUF6152 family protein [Marmoricola sp. Leaf446]|uniref:DUF6152 family protein n=1 Tax=Marmoricola sp. Leaf446 TaxID=1736379 RepID=UPI000A87EBF7|nr:DUF6152 family protein [Marmoricola sp. Leaf446]